MRTFQECVPLRGWGMVFLYQLPVLLTTKNTAAFPWHQGAGGCFSPAASLPGRAVQGAAQGVGQPLNQPDATDGRVTGQFLLGGCVLCVFIFICMPTACGWNDLQTSLLCTCLCVRACMTKDVNLLNDLHHCAGWTLSWPAPYLGKQPGRCTWPYVHYDLSCSGSVSSKKRWRTTPDLEGHSYIAWCFVTWLSKLTRLHRIPEKL